MRNLKIAAMVAVVTLVVWIMACGGVFFTFFGDIMGVSSVPPPPGDTPVPLPPVPNGVDTWTRSTDGAVMVYVPAGEFLMGSTAGDIDAVLA